jgi:plastocyanin
MKVRIGLPASMLSLLALVAGSVLGALPASAAGSRTLVIGVDNFSPAKENFAFLDYYPRAGIKLHNGDVVGFRFTPPATSDEIHTATLGTPDETAVQIFNSPKYPGVINDADDPAPPGLPFQFQFPNSLLFASNPPAVVPGGCGTQALPCAYDGTTETNSGILCQSGCPNSEYFYKIAVPSVPESGLTVHWVCLIHGPTMQGTLRIVPAERRASTQRQLNAAAREQYEPQVDQAFEAKESGLAQARRTGQVMAGAEDPSGRVQVLEMLPQKLEIPSGKSITWLNPTLNEIHTVTFPSGSGSDAVDPLPFVCEGSPDTAATFPGGVPCGDPTIFENHFNPLPQGVTTIASPSDVGSSGVIASIPGAPFPPSYSFTFSSAGTATFTYQCRIHNHMTGTVTVGGEGDD